MKTHSFTEFSFHGDLLEMQVCGVLGQFPVFVLQRGFHKGDHFVLAVFVCPRCILFQTLELWPRSSTPMTRSVRRSRWCTRQMVPPTPPWMVLSTHWSTSIPWKLRRHVGTVVDGLFVNLLIHPLGLRSASHCAAGRWCRKYADNMCALKELITNDLGRGRCGLFI